MNSLTYVEDHHVHKTHQSRIEINLSAVPPNVSSGMGNETRYGDGQSLSAFGKDLDLLDIHR